MFAILRLGKSDELVIGGFHTMDCVKRVAEVTLENNRNTLVDLVERIFDRNYSSSIYGFTK